METDLIDTKELDENEGNSEIESHREYDIVEALRLTDHMTSEFTNGMTLGVKLESVLGTKGVHVDVVFVLDLRKASFGKGGLAMRAAVLETVNRDLARVLNDVGLGEFIHEHIVLTPWGRIRLPLLRGKKNGSTSLIHETRTVYVITENTKPTFDLSWLTETGRIVTPDQFTLIRQSDARSKLPDLKKSVTGEKWNLLQNGLIRGWFGILSLFALAIGLSTSASILLIGSGSLLVPVMVSTISGVIAGWLLSSSRSSVSSFQMTLTKEHEQLRTIGDTNRISSSIKENEERLKLIADLNFVVSPLLATLGDAISSNDNHEVITIACSVLDECVRLAPWESDYPDALHGDEGLRKFIGLFEHLGGNIEETNLALAYVAFTGHLTKPLAFGEVITHLTELINSLYDIGAIRPDIKGFIDDSLNRIALKEAVQEIDKEIQSDIASQVDASSVEVESPNEVDSIQDESCESSDSLNDDQILDQILNASIDDQHVDQKSESLKTTNSMDGNNDEIAIVGADIVSGRMKKRKSRIKESDQLSLLEDIDIVQSNSEIKEERGSAGV